MMLTDITCGKMICQARMDAGYSVPKAAAAIGVAEKTLRNWEAGQSSPSLPQALQLFAALGLSPVPYIQHWLYPEQGRDADACRRRIEHWMHNMATTHSLQELSYLLTGRHGSSAAAMLEMITADLACPMSDRYAIAASILAHYKLREAENTLSDAVPPPDIQRLTDAIAAGMAAAAAGRNHYTQIKEE